MYVGIEYESRFLLNLEENALEDMLLKVEHDLNLMDFKYDREYFEEDYYFYSSDRNKSIKCAIDARVNSGRIIYKEEITKLGFCVINLELSQPILFKNICNITNIFPKLNDRDFDFNNVGKVFQKRRKYIFLGENRFENIGCSVDFVKNGIDSYLFVEFETSVSEASVVDNLERISKNFSNMEYARVCDKSKKEVVMFETNK